MKKIIFNLIIIFVLVQANAQLTTVLNVQANPSAVVSSWGSSPQTITFVVNNVTQAARTFKIKATIKTTSGDVVATTDLSKVPVYNSLGGTSNVYNALTAMPYEYLQFSGKYNSILQRSGKLPTETYQLCMQLVNPLDYAVITQEQCKIFNIAALQLPFLISPNTNTVLDKNIAQSVITFRWTPVVPRPLQSDITYRLQVFEVLEGQKPMQAFRANMPVLDVDVKQATQYIWRPQMSFDESIVKDSTRGDSAKTEIVKTFIWTIQTVTKSPTGGILPLSNESINGDGRSEPVVFNVTKKITFPPNAVVNKKITFPPNAVAKSVVDKIVFPPNAFAIFCPTGTIGVDGKCVTIDIPLGANARVTDGMFDGKKQMLNEEELQKLTKNKFIKGATYVGTVIKTIDEKPYLISVYHKKQEIQTIIVPLVNENGFLKMQNTSTIVTETNGQKLIFTKDEPVKRKRSQEVENHHLIGHVTLLR